MFRKVCIIGCGLIGSSIARAIKKKKLSNKIVSSNRSQITNKKVEGEPHNPLFVTTFLNPPPPYDIILRIISRYI